MNRRSLIAGGSALLAAALADQARAQQLTVLDVAYAGSMGSIYAEKALYGSGAAMTTPAKSGRASGSASRGMRTGSCDFIFGTVCSSAVQDRLGNKRPYHGRSPSLLKGGQDSKPRLFRWRSRLTG